MPFVSQSLLLEQHVQTFVFRNQVCLTTQTDRLLNITAVSQWNILKVSILSDGPMTSVEQNQKPTFTFQVIGTVVGISISLS